MSDNIINVQSVPNYTIDIDSQPAITIELQQQGGRGKAGTIAVGTTTTLPSGSDATVANVGTANDAIFNFGIPKGTDGIGDMDSSVYDPASGARQVAFNDDLTSHTGNTSNPHSVTKAQVGLSNVPDTDCTNASSISSGTLGDARLTANVTVQGNTFNGNSQLIQTTSAGKYPALDGSLITGITGGGLTLSDLGSISTNQSLTTMTAYTASITGTVQITLPTSLTAGIENVVVFDFTTTSSSQPTIATSGTLKWSKYNNGVAPTAYSTVSGVRNVLVFKTHDGGTTWEAEYDTFGSVISGWTQPTLASNGTLGTGTMAVYSPTTPTVSDIFNGFDNNTGTRVGWAVNNLSLYIWSQDPINVSNMAYTNTSNFASYGYPMTSCNIYGSNDNITYTYLTAITNSNNTGSATWNAPIGFTGYYKCLRLGMATTFGASLGFVQMTLTANKLT